MDITEVPDFNKMYELYDPCTVMFFFRYVLFTWFLMEYCWCGSLVGQSLLLRRSSIVQFCHKAVNVNLLNDFGGLTFTQEQITYLKYCVEIGVKYN